jgi:hypothetical protein
MFLLRNSSLPAFLSRQVTPHGFKDAYQNQKGRLAAPFNLL